MTSTHREPNEVRCALQLTVTTPAEIVLQVAAAGPDELVIGELLSASVDGELIPYDELEGAAGGPASTCSAPSRASSWSSTTPR